MNLLFASPEGIQIEEGLWAGRTGHPNTQMDLVHMGANDHTRGGWSFTATLSSPLADSFDAPHIQMKGCHVGKDSNLQGLRDGQGGSLLCLYTPSAMGGEDSRSTSSGS